MKRLFFVFMIILGLLFVLGLSSHSLAQYYTSPIFPPDSLIKAFFVSVIGGGTPDYWTILGKTKRNEPFWGWTVFVTAADPDGQIYYSLYFTKTDKDYWVFEMFEESMSYGKYILKSSY